LWGSCARCGAGSGGSGGGGGGGCGGAIEAVCQVLKKAPSDRGLESRKAANLTSTLTESCPELVQHIGVCSC